MPHTPNIYYKEVSTSNEKRRSYPNSNKWKKYNNLVKENGFLSIVKIDTNNKSG